MRKGGWLAHAFHKIHRSPMDLAAEAMPSCYRRMRHIEFQPDSGRRLQVRCPSIFKKCKMLVGYGNLIRS